MFTLTDAQQVFRLPEVRHTKRQAPRPAQAQSRITEDTTAQTSAASATEQAIVASVTAVASARFVTAWAGFPLPPTETARNM